MVRRHRAQREPTDRPVEGDSHDARASGGDSKSEPEPDDDEAKPELALGIGMGADEEDDEGGDGDDDDDGVSNESMSSTDGVGDEAGEGVDVASMLAKCRSEMRMAWW